MSNLTFDVKAACSASCRRPRATGGRQWTLLAPQRFCARKVPVCWQRVAATQRN
ncbi:MAG: hypothetical protein KBA29_09385 [Moraxellaceae bacterium]|nr:hypothetical protein [Moraxellaceae bacterium]